MIVEEQAALQAVFGDDYTEDLTTAVAMIPETHLIASLAEQWSDGRWFCILRPRTGEGGSVVFASTAASAVLTAIAKLRTAKP